MPGPKYPGREAVFKLSSMKLYVATGDVVYQKSRRSPIVVLVGCIGPVGMNVPPLGDMASQPSTVISSGQLLMNLILLTIGSKLYVVEGVLGVKEMGCHYYTCLDHKLGHTGRSETRSH